MDSQISALISDVDHTLLTTAQILTPGAVRAVNRLRVHNVAFGLISGRPLRGVTAITNQLVMTAPIAAFNGGMLAAPNLAVLKEHPIPHDIARRACEIFTTQGADVWVFTAQDWLLRDAIRPHVAHEEGTIGFPPLVVEDFGDSLASALKIVGVSDNSDILARCAAEANASIGHRTTIALSPPYHVDITHVLANKGAALHAASGWLNIPVEEIAVIGDGLSDIAMFESAGLAIAMGNATPEVKARADKITGTCDDDGFAQAVEQFIL